MTLPCVACYREYGFAFDGIGETASCWHCKREWSVEWIEYHRPEKMLIPRMTLIEESDPHWDSIGDIVARIVHGPAATIPRSTKLNDLVGLMALHRKHEQRLAEIEAEERAA